ESLNVAMEFESGGRIVIGELAKAVLPLAPWSLTLSATLNEAHSVPFGTAFPPAWTVNVAAMKSPGLKVGRSQKKLVAFDTNVPGKHATPVVSTLMIVAPAGRPFGVGPPG